MTEAELERALRCGARLIAVNNRDLKTLEVDLGRVARLVRLCPPDRVLVSASGVKTHAQLVKIDQSIRAASPEERTAGTAYLIGSAFSLAADPSAAVREILFGACKVCGVTRAADARAVPFCEAPVLARACRAAASEAGLPVGIEFVLDDEEALLPEMTQAVSLARPDALQIHGLEKRSEAERGARLEELRAAYPGLRIAAAIPAEPTAFPDFNAAIRRGLLDALLFDGGSCGRMGGTGRPILLEALEPLSGELRVRSRLAGGLGASNAAAADRLGFAGLDFNSGVESAPGLKSREKLAEVFLSLKRGIAPVPDGSRSHHSSLPHS